MAVHDRTRLIGQLHLSSGYFGGVRRGMATSIRCNCLIFKHNHLMRYFQYAQYPIVFIAIFLLQKTLKLGINKLP